MIGFVPQDKRLWVLLVLALGGSAYLYSRNGCFERLEYIVRTGVDPGPNFCRNLFSVYDGMNR